MKKIIIAIVGILAISVILFVSHLDFAKGNQEVDQLTKKLSIEGTIYTSLHNLSSIKDFEGKTLKFRQEEMLDSIDGNETSAFVLNFLGLDIADEKSNVEQIFTSYYFDKDYAEEIWAAYGEKLNSEKIINKIKSNAEFTEFSINDQVYYSCRFKRKSTGKLYSAVYIYVDKTSVVISSKQEAITKVLTNKSDVNYWPTASNKLFYNVNIVNVPLFRKYGRGYIKSVDFKNAFQYISSLEYSFTKSIMGNVILNINSTEVSNENTDKVKAELEKLKLDVIKKVGTLHNKDLNSFTNSIAISSSDKSTNTEVTLPVSLLNFIRFNLISSFKDFITRYPQVAFGSSSNDNDVKEVLAEKIVKYKENYQYQSDFPKVTVGSVNPAPFNTKLEITKIGYTDKEKRLFINIKLTPLANKNLAWQYKYLDFSIRSVSTKTGFVNFTSENGGELPAAEILGKQWYIKKTIVFPDGVKHSDLQDINTVFTFLAPITVKKAKLTEKDINNSIAVGSGGTFTLTGFNDQGDFSYNISAVQDSLIEVRPLNNKGKALEIGNYYEPTKSIKYPKSGITANHISKTAEGSISALDIYYVSKFNKTKIVIPYVLPANIFNTKVKSDSKDVFFKITSYKPASHNWLIEVDDFTSKILANYPRVYAGPFDIYLRDISKQGDDLRAEFYVVAPKNDSIFKHDLGSFELIVDNIIGNNGILIKRPSDKVLKQWQAEDAFYHIYNWSILGPFKDDMFDKDKTKYSVLEKRLALMRLNKYKTMLGKEFKEEDIKQVNGHINVVIPQSVVKINIDKLAIGDVIKSKNVELNVVKYDESSNNNHAFYLKVVKGLNSIVQIKVKNVKTNVHKKVKFDINVDMLTLEPLAKDEAYEFVFADKTRTYKYNFKLNL